MFIAILKYGAKCVLRSSGLEQSMKALEMCGANLLSTFLKPSHFTQNKKSIAPFGMHIKREIVSGTKNYELVFFL